MAGPLRPTLPPSSLVAVGTLERWKKALNGPDIKRRTFFVAEYASFFSHKIK